MFDSFFFVYQEIGTTCDLCIFLLPPAVLATFEGDHVGSHTTPHTATTGAGEGALVIFGGRTEKLRELLPGGG